MLKGFEGYYPPDFKRLWKEAVFVFDANVLLDLFRYSPKTRKELLDILEKLDDRIWIPHQFFYEYHRNKMTVHSTIAGAYSETEKQLEECRDITRKQMQSLTEKLQNLKNRTGVEINARIDKIDEVFVEIQSELSNSREQHQSSLDSEPLEENIAQLFEDNYGDPFDDARLNEIRKIAKERMAKGIPPGSSKDSNKEKSDSDGDLIGWLQTIDYADCKKLPIILVTNDGDWFLSSGGKTIGPNPELLQEMYDKAQVSCYIFKTSQFIKYAKDYLEAHVSEKTIEETENRENYISWQDSLGQLRENARLALGMIEASSQAGATITEALQSTSDLSRFLGRLHHEVLLPTKLPELSNEAFLATRLPELSNEAFLATRLPELGNEALGIGLPLLDNAALQTGLPMPPADYSPTVSASQASEIPTTEEKHNESNDNDDADDEPAP